MWTSESHTIVYKKGSFFCGVMRNVNLNTRSDLGAVDDKNIYGGYARAERHTLQCKKRHSVLIYFSSNIRGSTFRNDNGVSHGGQRSVPIGSPKGARFVSCLGKTEVFVMRGYCSHVCVSSTSAKIIHVSTHTLYLPALPVTGAASERAHCMRPITSAPVNSLLILRST
jgi:hypothetical protein